MKRSELISLIQEAYQEVINESFISDQPDSEYVQELVDTATNESKFYDSKDAKGAIQYAMKVLLKEKYDNMVEDYKKATPKAIQELTKYWKNN